MELKEQRTTKRDLMEVFEYTADFSNIENWDPGVTRSRKEGQDPVAVGSRFHVDVKFGPRTIPMTYVVTLYDPPNRVVLVGKGGTIEAVDDIRFALVDGRTLIDYTADLTFHGAARIVMPLLKPVMERVLARRALDGLVAALDG